MHYLIARREVTGFELPHTFFYSGEGALPVFSSVEAARGFLASRNLGQGWRVRECSAGELVSLLFVLHEKVAWVLLNPLPEPLSDEDSLSSPVSRDDFIGGLIAR